MKVFRFRGIEPAPSGRGFFQPKAARKYRHGAKADQGFTLVELLIVVTIVPVIIGALAAGLLAMFSLQSSVSNRLSNSGDAQAVAASFRIDVQSAAFITTSNSASPQCGTGNRLLGLEWNPTPGGGGGFQTNVSYTSIQVSANTFRLVREYCTSGNMTPVSITTISSNLQGSQSAPSVAYACLPTGSTCDVAQQWIDAKGVTGVRFQIQQPESSGKQVSDCANNVNCYTYTLAAVPATSASSVTFGAPITSSATAGCGFADPGSGPLASSLCLVDFSALTGNNLIAARQGCLAVAVPLPGGATMYFCIGITGGSVIPAALPSWTQSFLGNTLNGAPFYTGIPGEPAIYQNGAGNNGGLTTITISNIKVIGKTGIPATGWEIVGIDAESTDDGEYIRWSSDSPLYLIPNGQVGYDTPTDPVGNACNSGLGISPQSVITPTNSSMTITCNGHSTSGNKTGTAMVETLTPTTLTTTMFGTGLEGMAFGLVF